MIETTIKDSQTVIYVGGGNFMTQARPTNFHSFWTEKRLLPGESVGDFREVTAAERAALEKSDAAWVRPPQSFIDAWDEAWNVPGWFGARTRYGQWNEESGFFEGNGLFDITYPQARVIMACPPQYVITNDDAGLCVRFANYSSPLKQCARTFIPLNHEYLAQCSMKGLWQKAYYAEVVRWPGTNAHSGYGATRLAFDGCNSLRTILGEIKYSVGNIFNDAPKLENISVYAWDGLDLSKCPKLTAESARFTAGHIVSTQTAATVKLHPNVYAALTDDILELAAQTGVTFAA